MGGGGGKVIEIYARKNISVKEIRVSIPPPWAFIFGKVNGV